MNMNNQKGFANIILIAVIVILVGAVGYFVFVKKPISIEQQTNNNTPKQNQEVAKPVISLVANPTDVVRGGSTTLIWSAKNAVSCEASSPTAIDITATNWAGSINLSGTKIIRNIPHDVIFELTCKNSAGLATFVSVMIKTSSNQQESSVETQVRTAVEKVLSQGTLPNPNEQMSKGIKLLSVSVVTNKVTLNFSKEIISKGQGVFEDTFSLVSNAIHPIIQGEGKDPKYPELNITVLVEGKPLNEIFK